MNKYCQRLQTKLVYERFADTSQQDLDFNSADHMQSQLYAKFPINSNNAVTILFN